MSASQKPPRTFGLALAILLSCVYFSLLPLIFNGYTWALRRHFEQLPGEIIPEAGSEAGLDTPYFAGVEGLPEINFWQILLSLVFFVVAVFAWRGRPPTIRYILMIAILGVTVYNLVLTFSQPVPDPAITGFDSSAQITETLTRAQLFGNFLVVFYVVWYINRAPARAFFRGSYLPEPKPESEQGA